MRRLAILLVCCSATRAWADVPLLYDGFDYDIDLNLSPPGTTDQEVGQGLQNPGLGGKYWFSAGGSTRPLVAAGNVYDAGTGLPAPGAGSHSISLSGLGSDGTASRIEIPNMPTGARTVYWSGFLRVSDISNLSGAPTSAEVQSGAFLAGFNNLVGSQTDPLSTVGGILALKRGSANPSSPRYQTYYAGTAPNSASSDCTFQTSYACANRRYADYDVNLDVPSDAVLYPDLPSTYKSAGAAARSKFTAVPLLEGQTYFFVGAQQIVTGLANDVAMLWISPDPGTFGTATAPAPNVSVTTTTGGTDPSDVLTFFLRNRSGVPNLASFDELRVGLSWASVTAPMVPQSGDYNGNGFVDAADYVLWRVNNGLTSTSPVPTVSQGNGNGDSFVDEADYTVWRTNFVAPPGVGSGSLAGGGAVPEPGTLVLVMFAIGSTFGSKQLRWRATPGSRAGAKAPPRQAGHGCTQRRGGKRATIDLL